MVAVVVRVVVERVHGHHRVEQVLAEDRRELRLDPARPPGVDDLDRLGVLVGAVAVGVDPVGAVLHPRAQLVHSIAQLRVVRPAEHAQGPRQHSVAAQVHRRRIRHRLGELRKRRLPVPGDQALDSVVEQLRAVDGPIAPVAVGGAVAVGLLAVPVGDVALVDHVRALATGCRGVDQRAPRLAGVPIAPLEPLAGQRGQAGVHAARAKRVGARVLVGDVLGVRVEPVERERDQAGGALEAARARDLAGVVEVREREARSRSRAGRCCGAA